MVEVHTNGGKVRFEVLGRDKFYAAKRRVDVPVAHITGVRRAGADVGRPRGLRLAGASVPGFIYAGSFWGRGSGWTFWDVRVADAANVIVVELKDDFYRQLVVEVRDPDAAISAIESARAAFAS
jgi:hypothetical protein